MKSNVSRQNLPQRVVMIVDDVVDNLAMLHDALDESGFMVMVASSGQQAIESIQNVLPDAVLLDAMMPGMDGFEVCRQLKADINTRHIPVIFMTGLTESEHVVAAFDAGGCDYVTKPVRANEVIARLNAHMQTSRMVNQARVALDAFGQAALAVTPQNARIVWQTPLASTLLLRYFSEELTPVRMQTPDRLRQWLLVTASRIGGEEAPLPLIVTQAYGRLIFNLAETADEDHWIIVLHEESDAAKIEALMASFKLTLREAEVLYWVAMGKTSRDIGDILGSSPRTVNKHLEHVFIKLGVETRTAAAALAINKIRL